MDKSSNPWHDMGGSLGDLNSANRYVYIGDDPVNATDPSGKYSTTDLVIACVVGAVGGIAALYLTALIPVILMTGPAGVITLGAAILAILFGCILAELAYNLTQLLHGTL